MQDQLSKYCLAAPIPNATSITIADEFIKRCISFFGAPRSILTDQGSNFLSSLMQRVCKRFRIEKIKTTSYAPASNGSLERSHHVLNEYLKQYVDKDNQCDVWVDLAMMAYNTSVHTGTKFSPYEIVFGKTCRMWSDVAIRE